MNSRTIDVVTDWETVSAPEGFEGLHQLADEEFSGAVSTGMTWAFFLNGRVIGVFEGGIGDFEGADLTAYRAADPSLPLLFAMQERGGETRAKYYTNDTPLADADQTLSNGGFTGYIELSENVLSGDYYVVYHGGKSMSAAFVGNSDRLITGDEAFETAADEVGIYRVIDADVDIVDIPEPVTEDEPAAEDGSTDGAEPAIEADESDEVDRPGAAGGVESESAAETTNDRSIGSANDGSASASAGEGGAGAREAEPAPNESAADDRKTASDASTDAPERPATSTSERSTTAADAPSSGTADDERSPGSNPERRAAERDPESTNAAGAGADSTDAGADTAPKATAASDSAGARSTEEPKAAADDESAGDDVFSDEERWREARTIPSLDPGESSQNGTAEGAGDERDRQSARTRAAGMQKQRAARREARQRAGRSSGQSSARSGGAGGDRTSDRTEEGGEGDSRTDAERLEKRLSRARNRVEELEAERQELLAEREELRNERAKYRDRVEELEAEREELRSRVERLESELEGASEASGTESERESMSPDRALSGTNLFVRYDQKGGGTLADAHAGEVSREEVRKNLRLEHHTTFEADGVVVDGRPYEEFLRDSTAYAFAKWVVTELLYEIGETGNRTALAGVFDAIPDIDRVELYGTAGADTEDGVEQRDFDVIFRDKMGDPLFVADINASRNATTEAMVESLVGNTATIAEGEEPLAAGFYVTESFYEPGALEAVSEETGGGLLSRSKKLSYVKLSRKQGYHLCLVEARGGEFHLNVPDL